MNARTSISRPGKPVLALALSAWLATLNPLPAFAEEAHGFDIAAMDASAALRAFGKQAGVEVMASGELLGGKTLNRVSGEQSVDAALQSLLAGSGLTHRYVGDRGVVLLPVKAAETIRIAQAETTSVARDETEVEEVIVTSRRPFKPENSEVATKFPLPLVETPQSISVLTDDLLATVGAHDIFDLDGLVPGLQEQGTSNGFDARFVMRGFALSREDGMKIDGVSIPNRFILDLAAIERVEVVRGPSSVIYGQTDYGGTLNFVLKRPQLGESVLSARAIAGTDDLRRAEVDASLPLGESSGVRIVGAYEDADSFVDLANHETKVLAPSFLFNLGERTNLFISTYFQERDGRDHLGFGAFAGGEIPKVRRENFFGPAWNRYDSRASQSIVQLRHGMTDNFDLTFNASYSDVTTGFRTGYSRARPDAAGNTTLLRNGDGDTRAKTTFAEVVGTWRFAGFGAEPSLISMTADMRTIEERGTTVGGVQPVIGAINIFDPSAAHLIPYINRAKTVMTDSENALRGISATTLLRFPHEVNLMLGGRYGEATTSTLRLQTGATGGVIGVGNAGAKQRNDVFVPKVGVTWQFVPNWYAYGTYAEGVIFKFERDYRDDMLPNETGVQKEVGVKADLFGKRLGLAAAVFSIDRKDVLIGDPQHPDYSTTADAQEHRGLELEALGQPLPGLNISLNYSWLDVKVTDVSEFGSNRQANVPKHSGGMFVNQEFRSGWLDGLSAGFGVSYVDDRAADSFSTPSAVLPSYTKLDLFAAYQFNERLRLGVNARNVTDEDILVSSFGVDFLGLMYREARSVSVTFDVKL